LHCVGSYFVLRLEVGLENVALGDVGGFLAGDHLAARHCLREAVQWWYSVHQ
jgi:hypothetical protein